MPYFNETANECVLHSVSQAPQKTGTPVVGSSSAHACDTPEKETSRKAHAISTLGFESSRLSRLEGRSAILVSANQGRY